MLNINNIKYIYLNVLKVKPMSILKLRFTFQYLSDCDTVILLKDGRIAEIGPYEKLMQDEKVTLFLSTGTM